ncbi:hypothetical protein JB92DRAFT_2691415 [Gautieria morchelliformis]|nr:hypothetical protein JB92DRAFT_2691415 [Gautieria morchelliformis]
MSTPTQSGREHTIVSMRQHVTRQTYVDRIVTHPRGAVVEFPVSGAVEGEAVAHVFAITCADWVHPKHNLQYSLGDAHGGHKDVKCHLLTNAAGVTPVLCYQTRLSCRSVKACGYVGPCVPAAGVPDDGQVDAPCQTCAGASCDSSREATREVFNKTLGLYAALLSRGCSWPRDTRAQNADATGWLDATPPHGDGIPLDARAMEPSPCGGHFLLCWSTSGSPFLQCSEYRNAGRAHLKLSQLGEFNLIYLDALLTDNRPVVEALEKLAQTDGYGPLATCDFMATWREQKQLCRNGSLERGILMPCEPCPTRFDMYVPNDLEATPYIVLVSRHPDPKPTRAPLTILGKFQNMVRDLGWHLADATPRRLALNSTFMASLHQELDWAHPHDPALSHLHPSLGNSDHVGRIIQDLRLELYPGGTGIKGAERFLAHQQTMPLPEQYLRCVESVSIPGHEPFIIIICMLPAMSQLLITTRRPSIDTSFKRADSYQEFEIEAWYPEQKKSIVCARAFTTSQSAPAHYHLFKRIFEIVEHDTGRPVHFRHIHGDGIETIVADAHKGQALGEPDCPMEMGHI